MPALSHVSELCYVQHHHSVMQVNCRKTIIQSCELSLQLCHQSCEFTLLPHCCLVIGVQCANTQTCSHRSSPTTVLFSHRNPPTTVLFSHRSSPTTVLFSHRSSPTTVLLSHRSSPTAVLFSHRSSPRPQCCSLIGIHHYHSVVQS